MTGRDRPDAAPEPVVRIDGIPVHDVGFDRAAALIREWAADGSGGYVTTPNVDHIVKARRDPAFRSAVLGARLRVPDGMGIIYGARLAGTPLSETVTGRLLPEAVAVPLAADGIPVGLFGGAPDVAERAGSALRARGGLVTIALGPSVGFVVGSAEDDLAVGRIRASGARVVFVAFGAPKQERWMAAHAGDLPGVVLVGVGAAVDVLGGRVRAAPRWMTRIGLEWAYRLAREPRRLARRYLWDDPRFFLWMLRARWRRDRT